MNSQNDSPSPQPPSVSDTLNGVVHPLAEDIVMIPVRRDLVEQLKEEVDKNYCCAVGAGGFIKEDQTSEESETIRTGLRASAWAVRCIFLALFSSSGLL